MTEFIQAHLEWVVASCMALLTLFVTHKIDRMERAVLKEVADNAEKVRLSVADQFKETNRRIDEHLELCHPRLKQ